MLSTMVLFPDKLSSQLKLQIEDGKKALEEALNVQGEFAMKNADLQLKYIELQEEHEKYSSHRPSFPYSIDIFLSLPLSPYIESARPGSLFSSLSFSFSLSNPTSWALVLSPLQCYHWQRSSAQPYFLTCNFRLKKQMQGYELAMVEMQHRIMELQMKAAGVKK